MTRRILLGFLGVLSVVIVAVVVPLGLVVTAQQTNDFGAAVDDADRAIAAVAEEHLDDNAPLQGLHTVISRFAAGGDRIVVLNARGDVIARGGGAIPAPVQSAALHNVPLPRLTDAVVAVSPIGDADRHLGLVVLVRDAEPLDHRHAVLWASLAAAGAATVVLGGVVGWSLGRWIGRPLGSLVGAARSIGEGRSAARAATDTGPAQVREVGSAFNDMADRVTALLDVQRGMTADVSHQLRTPLAALRLRLELLAGDLEPGHADEVAAMVRETNRLARLVDGLLAVARAEAVAPAPAAIDLAALAVARVDAWQPVAAEQDIRISVDAQEALAWATPGGPEQILDNLLDNAIGALPSSGLITVCTRSTPQAAIMTIADDGPGMSAEQRSRATDRFVTGRSDRGRTGLGLSIVHRLAGADGAAVVLDETPGGGLTVTVTFPATRSAKSPGR
jgi:signal transduction histidine kinase